MKNCLIMWSGLFTLASASLPWPVSHIYSEEVNVRVI